MKTIGFRRFLCVTSLFFLFCTLTDNYAQERSRQDERRLFAQDFNQRYGADWEIVWDQATQTPHSMWGQRILTYTGTPTEIASAFLHAEKALFGIADVERELALEKTKYTKRGHTLLQFVQHYRGVPVMASGYLIAVDEHGGIYYLTGKFFPEIDVNVVPSLATTSARAAIQADLAASRIASISTPQLMIQADVSVDQVRYSLVYRADASTRDPFSVWQYAIDAHTGAILSKASAHEEINGNGDVYETNPLHGSVVNRTIHRLRDISPRKLDGDNVVVLNDSTSEASSSTATFVYDTTDTHFDEVMAYYHSDEFEAWLIGKGMGTGQVAKVTVHTESTAGYAFAIPANRIIHFSDGEAFSGLRNPTKEAALIAHEYMHVVSETYNSLNHTPDNQHDQEDAMDEAYSDYFAVAYTNQFHTDSQILEYVDEPDGYTYTRDLDNQYHMSEYGTIDTDGDEFSSAHDRSQIFSGALWDVRNDADVSASNVDELVLESLDYLGTSPDFQTGRVALKIAATNSGLSAYHDDIDAAFGDHGILAAPANLTLTNAGNVGENPELDWDASPSASSYRVYRCVTNSIQSCSYEQIGSTTSTSYTDVMVEIRSSGQSNDTFHYAVAAVSQGVESPWSTSVSTIGEQVLTKEVVADRVESTLPETFILLQNHPNPFNPQTELRYGLPQAGYVELGIVNILGQQVRTLVAAQQQAGWHRTVWDGRDDRGNVVPAGVYLYRLTVTASAGGRVWSQARKMALAR